MITQAQLSTTNTFRSTRIETPLGPLLAIADEQNLHLLAFTDQKGLDKTINQLLKQNNAHLAPGTTAPLTSITTELKNYFNGTITTFETPFALSGTPFQQVVWQELNKIPFGQTQSYKEIATAIGKPQSCRAVAQANACNKFSIIVPCHRVIAHNGTLSGYNGGVERKQWLLEHEKILNLVIE
jgi:AraC family transcriptional regulator of adaptative response/methylated-DNA-[protein]-cysteine methyltransferase